ncbi:TolC family protein [Citrobacter cronae]|uniref:TolC family protein n=1 Tax=Citrobacter cronae TaxID=1748967 RepID=UPI00195C8F7F|nr:TolC family protein [Citrobacter cronae]
MNKSVIALLILGSSLPLAICAHAETGGHTLPLRTLIVDALNTQPSVAIASWETEMRHQETNMSKASLYPTLDVSSEAIHKKTDEHDNEQNVENKLTFAYRIADFGVRSSNISKSEQQEEASKYDFQQELLTTAQKTADAYLSVEKTRQILAVIDDEKIFYKQMLNDFSELIAAGAAMQSDIRKVQVSIDSLSTQELNFRAQLDTQLMMLRNLTGDNVTAENLGKLPDFFNKYPFNVDKDAVYKKIMQDNPTYLSLTKAISAANAEYSAAKSANYPVVDFNAHYTDNNPSKDAQQDDYEDELQVGVKVGFNIFNGFKNQSEAAKFSAKYTQAKLGLDDFIFKTRNSVDASVSKYMTGKDSLAISKRSYENAGKLIELYKEEFKLGQKSLLDFISSRNEHYQANLTMIESQFSIYQAKLEQMAQLADLLHELYLEPGQIQPKSGSMSQ